MTEYFIVFISGNHIGNAKVILHKERMSMSDIRALEKKLGEKYNNKVVILNFVKLSEIECEK